MKKLYVLVRTDLKKSSPAVQAGHAVAQYMLDHPDSDWNNSYLIYLRVRSLDELNVWKSKLLYGDFDTLKLSSFSEPDLNNELTAIAASGLNANLFSTLKLL